MTGATGFVGQHLVSALLAEGLAVRCLVRRLPGRAPGEADAGGSRPDVVVGDLHDRLALTRLVRGADAVIHLAGAIKAPSRGAFFAANRDGTRALAEAATAASVGRFVLVSTLAAREPGLSPYAASKRAGEEALAAAFPGRWIVLRPAAVYGPGDPETLPFFRAVARGFALRLNHRDAAVGLVHVADLVTAIRRALDPGGEGGCFEIDDGRAEGHRWNELLRIAGAAAGRRPVVLPVPRLALWATGLTAQLLGKVSGRAGILSAGKVREIHHADWGRKGPSLAAIGGWSPGVRLEHGFRETVAWYRRHGWF